jgi:hypothetical protein
MKAHRDRDRGRPQGRFRDESGNILVLFAIMLPLFLLCAAIVIDVGYWWAAGKRAQIAADACALAAAGELPQPWDAPPRTECVIAGQDYALVNLPDQSGTEPEPLHLGTTVRSPYDGDASMVEATVEMRVQTFFGRIVGLEWIDLTRRAVAEKMVGEGNYAIYSHSGGCPEDGDGNSLRFNGEHHSINGRVHSNGEYFVDNQGAEPFWAKIGTKVDCDSLQPPGGPKFGGDDYASGTTKPDTVAPQLWPAWWTPADFGWVDDLTSGDTCDVKGKGILIKEDGGNTKIEIDSPIGPQPAVLTFPGNTITTAYTYCAWEKFTINRINLVATLSAVAPLITVDGDNQTLAAHAGNAQGKVLFFAVPNITSASDGSLAGGGNPTCQFGQPPSPEMILNGNSHQWTGSVFNPCGRVVVNVGGSTIGSETLTGTILAMQVHVNGEDFLMIGKDNFGGAAELALVE